MLAALLLSSAVTLAVAALALLSPLEQRLRSEGESGVYAAISASRPEFEEIGVDPATGARTVTNSRSPCRCCATAPAPR